MFYLNIYYFNLIHHLLDVIQEISRRSVLEASGALASTSLLNGSNRPEIELGNKSLSEWGIYYAGAEEYADGYNNPVRYYEFISSDKVAVADALPDKVDEQIENNDVIYRNGPHFWTGNKIIYSSGFNKIPVGMNDWQEEQKTVTTNNKVYSPKVVLERRDGQGELITTIDGERTIVKLGQTAMIELSKQTIEIPQSGDSIETIPDPRNQNETTLTRKGRTTVEVEVTPSVVVHNFGQVKFVK